MPIYDYRCEDCGEKNSIQRGFTDSNVPTCFACGSQHMVRIYSPISQVKTGKDRITDLSWVDKNLAGRIKKKASDKLNPGLKDAVDRMESK
jgi:putative FmdB family regulatory protein